MNPAPKAPSPAKRVIEALGFNTAFMYRYRDASNHKNSAVIIFRGRPVDADDEAAMRTLASYADDGLYFIPEQVGLNGLQSSWGARYSEDDHAWHELITMKCTDAAPTDFRHVNEFIDEFGGQSWDIEFSAIADELRGFNVVASDAAWVLDV